MRFRSIGALLFFLFQHINIHQNGAFAFALSRVNPRSKSSCPPLVLSAKSNVQNSPIGDVLLPQSDRIIHIGNLDWTLPIADVSDIILQAAGIESGATDEDVHDIARANVNVTFSELPVPRRKRDEGKFHGGSAKLAFETAEEAKMAMEALQAFSDSHTGQEELRFRWATIPKDSDHNIAVKELSAEMIQRRKDRAESYARRRQRVAEKTDEVIQKSLAALQDMNMNTGTSTDLNMIDNMNIPVLNADRLNWSTCPEEIDPVRGGGIRKGTDRGERKQAAVEAFLLVVQAALLDEDEDVGAKQRRFIADLGCGAGNLSIPLAWWLQKQGFGVLGIDINGQALDMLEKRASRAGIPIETLEQDLLVLMSTNTDDDSSAVEVRQLSDCAAVVSLHACGAASDMSMYAAIANNLPFAISPCCIGMVNKSRSQSIIPVPGRMPNLSPGERSAAPPEISYPRSMWLNRAVSLEEYQMLAAAADYGVGSSKEEVDEQELARRRRCRTAKQIVEIDRLQWAKEKGYYIRMMEMPRIGPLYPKRELLLGAKIGSSAASRISQLPTI